MAENRVQSEFGGRPVEITNNIPIVDFLNSIPDGKTVCVFTEVTQSSQIRYPDHFAGKITEFVTDGHIIKINGRTGQFIFEERRNYTAWNTDTPMLPSPYANAGSVVYSVYAQTGATEDELTAVIGELKERVVYRIKR